MKIEVEAVEELLNKSKSDIFPEDYLGEIDIEEGSEEEEFIQLIAESGRKFFNHQDREGCCISHFTLKAGRTYFVDGYTKSEIYAYENHYFGNRFTEGGTMQALVLDIAEWIRTGEPTNAKNGYGGIYCDHWGYPPKAMAAIQRKAKEIGFTAGLEADLDRRGYIVE